MQNAVWTIFDQLFFVISFEGGGGGGEVQSFYREEFLFLFFGEQN